MSSVCAQSVQTESTCWLRCNIQLCASQQSILWSCLLSAWGVPKRYCWPAVWYLPKWQDCAIAQIQYFWPILRIFGNFLNINHTPSHVSYHCFVSERLYTVTLQSGCAAAAFGIYWHCNDVSLLRHYHVPEHVCHGIQGILWRHFVAAQFSAGTEQTGQHQQPDNGLLSLCSFCHDKSALATHQSTIILCRLLLHRTLLLSQRFWYVLFRNLHTQLAYFVQL